MLILTHLFRLTQKIKEMVHIFCTVTPKYIILPNPLWYCNKLFNEKTDLGGRI